MAKGTHVKAHQDLDKRTARSIKRAKRQREHAQAVKEVAEYLTKLFG
jgi:hypothetical protein